MDSVWKFYCTSVKVHHQIQNISETIPLHNLLTSRNLIYKEYGVILGEFMSTMIPTKLRYRRDFRIKFADDMDFGLLENSLISAAHRIIFSSQNDPSMNTCLPSASDVVEKIDILHISLFSHLKNIESRMRLYMAEKEESIPIEEEEILEKWLNDFVFGSRCILTKYSYHKSEIPQVPESLRDFLYISNEIIDYLKRLDEAIAEFEWKFVKMVAKRIRSLRQSDEIQRVCVLFSETIQWGLAIGLIKQSELQDRDPVIFLFLPRLLLIFGIRICQDGPISYQKIFNGQRIPYLFRNCLVEMASLARQLLALSQENLYILIQWIGPKGMPNIALKYTSKSHEDANGQEQKEQQESYEYQKFNHFHGLHYVYKKISNIADTICSENAADIRFLLQNSIEMNDNDIEEDSNDDKQTANPPNDLEDNQGCTESELEEDEYLTLIERVSKVSLISWREILAISKTTDISVFPTSTGFKRQNTANDKHLYNASQQTLEVGFDIVNWLEDVANSQNFQSSTTVLANNKKVEATLDFDQNEEEDNPSGHVNNYKEVMSKTQEEEKEDWKAERVENLRNVTNFLPLWQPNFGLHDELIDDSNDSMNISNSSDDNEDDSRNFFKPSYRLPVQGTRCGICQESFNLFRRRHHCRRCGFIFCQKCSSKARSLNHSHNQLFRVCDDCNEFLGPM